MKEFFNRHGQTLFNAYLFLNFAGWIGWQTFRTWQEGRFDYVEASFAVQNLIFVALVLVRSRHQEVDKDLIRQGVALVAFLSGMAFIGQPVSGGPAVASAAKAVIVLANILGVVCLLNLGRSFGILIARRVIKTGGLYGYVRHPMYGTDILLRVGYLIGHWNAVTVVLFLGSSACYVYRAILEERFLGRQPEYQEYMRRVRYRFIPYLF